MIHIRPVSDLRNKFSEIEKIVASGEPVFLTKNGYGNMVVMSIEQYSALRDGQDDYIERMLDEADREAESTDIRLTHEEVFGEIRRKLSEKL